MLLGNAPLPLRDRLVEPGGFLTPAWLQYLTHLPQSLDAIPSRLATESLTVQSASVAASSIGGTLQGGLYRVSYFAYVTQAATTSSGLIVTIGWTQDGIAKTISGADMTGNTTATVQSGSMLIRKGTNTAIPITYATTYASVGATPMLYGLDVTLEKILA